MIVWIAQTPFDIPFFWTHKKLKDFHQPKTFASTNKTCFNKTSNILKSASLLCCLGWIGKDGNVGRWVAMMYRVIVSLTFCSIVAQIGGESKLEDEAITYLFFLTVYMPFFFSLFTLIVVTDRSNNDRALTLDRNVASVVAGGALNEVQDLKLFGMNIGDIDDDLVFAACKNGDVGGLKFFANRGIDFSVTNEDGDPPLM